MVFQVVEMLFPPMDLSALLSSLPLWDPQEMTGESIGHGAHWHCDWFCRTGASYSGIASCFFGLGFSHGVLKISQEPGASFESSTWVQ